MGLETLPKKVAVGLLFALLTWTAASLPEAFPHNAKPPWRDVAKRIDNQYGPIKVVVQEKWVEQPLDHYLREGQVWLWSEFPETEREKHFLFVCRPKKCSEIETEDFKYRQTFVETFHWGRPDDKYSEITQLNLYGVRSSLPVKLKNSLTR